MERREDKTREMQATTQSSSSNCSHDNELIPFDVTREILVRLPAKSLMRFRCVSKQWASVTSDPEFINSFTTHSSTQRSYLMLNFRRKDKQLFFSITQRSKDPETCLSHVEKYHHDPLLKEERCNSGHQFQSVHGLVSFDYKYHIVIWNPTLREYITFQKPYKSAGTKSYLGYDLIGNTYKLLSVLYFSTDEPHVLTLGAKESTWRKIKSIHTPFLPSEGICINGVLYYMFIDKEGRKQIISFDVRSEKSNLIKTHSRMKHGDSRTLISLWSYKGKLAWVFSESSCYKLWILEDAENSKWSCQDFSLPLSPEGPSIELYYCLHGVTNDGEFIYVSLSWRYKAVYVSYYDPERNSNRKIKVEILEDDDIWFRRYTYGWGFEGILSNHIENLMSLTRFTCSPSVSFVRES